MQSFKANRIAAAFLWMGLTMLPGLNFAQYEGAEGDLDVIPTAEAGRCHCPCTISCGEGLVECDCLTHSESCRKCHCASATLRAADLQLFATLNRPTLELAFAPWFDADPYPEIKVAIKTAMADTGREESWVLRWLQDSSSPWQYVPDTAFDREAFAAWVARIEPTKRGLLYAAVTDDPGTYRITDGDLNHLADSLEKTVSLVVGRGRSVPVFRSDSTLGWEMMTYLRQTVAGLDPSAFTGDLHDTRVHMLGRVDTLDLQIKGGDFDGALVTLEELIRRAEDGWLVKDNWHASSAICAFGKMRNLLSPGTPTCE